MVAREDSKTQAERTDRRLPSFQEDECLKGRLGSAETSENQRREEIKAYQVGTICRN